MKDRSALRSYFITNSIPTQENFQDFIDSVLNQAEDGIQKIQGGPVAVQAQGAGEDLLFFYKSFIPIKIKARFADTDKLSFPQ